MSTNPSSPPSSQRTIAVVYSSGNGTTRRVAEHVTKGAVAEPNINAELIEITAAALARDGRWADSSIMDRLTAADGIILGTPTYMGSGHGLFKLFLESVFPPYWAPALWRDKIAAGFTNSSSRSGDKLATLQQLAVFAAQMGMIWVGAGDMPGGNRTDSTHDDINHLGSWLGLMTQSPLPADGDETKGYPSAGDLLSAERFGRRVARATLRWSLGAQAWPPSRISLSEAQRRDHAGLAEWRTHKD